MNKKECKKELQAIADDVNSTELKTEVAEMLIDQLEGYENPEDMFTDLSYGCSSGIVSGLIYYKDTHGFAKKHIEDILEMLAVGQFDYNLRMPEDEDQLNWLAWFGFEQTADDIARELNINY